MPTNLHQWQPGDELRAEWLDEPRREMLQSITVGAGLTMKRTGRSVTIGMAQAPRAIGRGPRINATIVSSTPDENPHQWDYIINVPGVGNVAAKNKLELANTANTIATGLAVDTLPEGFAATPIGKDHLGRSIAVPVEAWTEAGLWYFAEPNSVSGECASPAAGGVPAEAFQAAGDLLAGLGLAQYIRMPVGDPGDVLAVDGAASTGLAWTRRPKLFTAPLASDAVAVGSSSTATHPIPESLVAIGAAMALPGTVLDLEYRGKMQVYDRTTISVRLDLITSGAPAGQTLILYQFDHGENNVFAQAAFELEIGLTSRGTGQVAGALHVSSAMIVGGTVVPASLPFDSFQSMDDPALSLRLTVTFGAAHPINSATLTDVLCESYNA